MIWPAGSAILPAMTHSSYQKRNAVVILALMWLCAPAAGRWEELSSGHITPRYAHAAAYHRASNALVVFGGMAYESQHEPLGDTWILRAGKWTELQTRISPASRANATMAYDPRRKVCVLFGGYQKYGDVDRLGDTWEFDGREWRQATPTVAPPARSFQAMAYDPTRKAMVLFGGFDGLNTLGDTWQYDGRTWKRIVAGDGPPPRQRAAMAWDAERSQLMLFGGSDGSNLLGDTWVLRGRAWKRLKTPHSPLPCKHMAMAYDADRRVVVLFGGRSSAVSGRDGQYTDDLWEFDGRDWRQIRRRKPWPAVRREHTMFYDPARRAVGIAGGRTEYWGPLLSDTWYWDGQNWQQRDPAWPQPRKAGAACYDADRKRCLLAGGTYAYLYYLDDTWALAAGNWSRLEGRSAPKAESLPALTRSAMVYDRRRARGVLFGGIKLLVWKVHQYKQWRPDMQSDETWELHDSVWRMAKPKHRPPARLNHAMAYDEQRGQTILFGGCAADKDAFTRTLDDTWAYDGADWSRLAPGVSPSARYGHAMTYDAKRRRVVLFGGGMPLSRETWEFDGGNWRRIRTKTAPSPRRHASIAFHRKAGLVVLFGGEDARGYLSDLWSYDGSNWRKLSERTGPAERKQAHLVYDEQADRMLLFGGRDGRPRRLRSDLWAWNGTAVTKAPPRAAVKPRRLPPPLSWKRPIQVRGKPIFPIHWYGGGSGDWPAMKAAGANCVYAHSKGEDGAPRNPPRAAKVPPQRRRGRDGAMD